MSTVETSAGVAPHGVARPSYASDRTAGSGGRSPTKKLIIFELSGHRPLFEEPDRFHQVMTDVVVHESEPGR